jgi:two-component system OmpR family response regulator
MDAGLVLIADDDPHLREVVRFALTRAGFRTVEAADGAAALALFDAHAPDLLVLDITMPELDGTEVCRALRRRSRVPILFLSSRDEEIDRVLGLELGGDDYMTKPFSPRELVARVKAILRRLQPPEPAPEPAPAAHLLRVGLLALDLDRFEAAWDGQPVALTATELHLLRTLMGFPGKVYSRDALMDGAYGGDVTVTDRTIDSHIRRVRQKFAAVGGDPVETVHGVGYRLGPCRRG